MVEKVCQKLSMSSVAKACIVYQELQHKKTLCIDFLIPLAEQLTGYGKERAKNRFRQTIIIESQSIVHCW
ncbi:hypothetical protein QE152_g21944 [Popillia japonica]|uniref:Uncharacterized protein n=1 Tax=Popillia japonica TaxID=7064 RepID=A0AAW1KKE1_POPJA